MSDKEKMLKEMRALWKRDPNLFDEIAREYVKKGKDVFPRDKRRRVKKQKSVLDWVWAHVEFLKWRDGVTVSAAFKRLDGHMSPFTLYDTETGFWRVGEEPQPPTFKYRPSSGKGLDLGESIKRTYYDAKKQTDMGMAHLILDLMKKAHEGEESIIEKKNLPPKV